eukprot:942644-Karenia_brevis.AAC.1
MEVRSARGVTQTSPSRSGRLVPHFSSLVAGQYVSPKCERGHSNQPLEVGAAGGIPHFPSLFA